MTRVEILIKARELISVPERWTQETMARTPLGDECPIDSDEASCWCAWGAISRVSTGDYYEAYSLITEMADYGVVNFNDTHTHAEVLGLFDRAIAAASTSTQPQT